MRIKKVILMAVFSLVIAGISLPVGRFANGAGCIATAEVKAAEAKAAETKTAETKSKKPKVIKWNSKWKYAKNSAIHTGKAKLYYAQKNRKDITVCINAGHGTKGGSSVKTLCHPDGTPKVTSGSTAKGATEATAIASGTTMKDGTPEAKVTLKLALILKDKLLAKGYDVLMVRESDDVQLDNIARTVIANKYADCHIALHYDSTMSDKGAFYMSVPNVKSYRKMEPVASNWKDHEKLGKALLKGMKEKKVKIFSSGSMAMDLTQISYSTIPSIDLEVGDRASGYSKKALTKISNGIAAGVDEFFQN